MEKGVMDQHFQFHDPLTNIGITKYFNYEPRFNIVFPRDNLPRIEDRADVINRDKQSKGTLWVSLFIAYGHVL